VTLCWDFSSSLYATPRCEYIRATTPSPNKPPRPNGPSAQQLLSSVKDIGYLAGVSGSVQFIMGATGGSESVWNLYDFEYALFDYIGSGVFASLGFGGTAYAGEMYGWSNFNPPGIDNYSGTSYAGAINGNVSIPGVKLPALGFSGGLVGFTNPSRTMYGYAGAVGTGLALCLPVDGNVVALEYVLRQPTKRIFHDEGKRPNSQDAQDFIAFIETTMTNPTRKQTAKDIVRQNGRAWDAYNRKIGQ